MLGYCKLCFALLASRSVKPWGHIFNIINPACLSSGVYCFFFGRHQRGEVGSDLLMDQSAFIVVFFDPLGGHALWLS